MTKKVVSFSEEKNRRHHHLPSRVTPTLVMLLKKVESVKTAKATEIHGITIMATTWSEEFTHQLYKTPQFTPLKCVPPPSQHSHLDHW